MHCRTQRQVSYFGFLVVLLDIGIPAGVEADLAKLLFTNVSTSVFAENNKHDQTNSLFKII